MEKKSTTVVLTIEELKEVFTAGSDAAVQAFCRAALDEVSFESCLPGCQAHGVLVEFSRDRDDGEEAANDGD